ncbi:cyclic nucleotide-binding domain-containing protein [Fodinicurvata sp. EGI_FJ10296]|uniref:Crp/Fnr family transcriptional regulator n=1 Tax=Fodinicurvata sp. EGI_FJ10296 TaxID=3231908 RepID=UPI003454EAD3
MTMAELRRTDTRNGDATVAQVQADSQVEAQVSDDIVTLEAGSLIYAKGEESNAVYFVESGTVELLQSARHTMYVVAQLTEGMIFGEMGVLRSRPRSVTARAKTNIRLRRVSKAGFYNSLRSANAIAMPLLRMLCERLEGVNSRIADAQPYGVGVERRRVKSITLAPGCNMVKGMLGRQMVRIDAYPYRVGRRANRGDVYLSDRQLLLPDVKTTSSMLSSSESPRRIFHLARNHFMVADLDGRLVVQDMGTPTGTIVNGTAISRFKHAGTAALDVGRNEIVAGTSDSPFCFCIDVQV